MGAAGLALAFTALSWTAKGQITMVNSNIGGQSWMTPAAWSDGLAAHAGENYEVGANFLLRTPATVSPKVFPGDSLSLFGQLNIQHSVPDPPDTTTQIDNFTLNPGSVVVNASANNATQTITGNFLNIAPGIAFMKSTGTTGPGGTRNFLIESLITGDPGATLHFLRSGTFTLNNANTTFGGIWKAGGSATITGADGGPTMVSNTTGVVSTIKAAQVGSLGIDASVALDLWSSLDFDFDWITTGSLSLASDSGNAGAVLVTLDQNITVGSLTVADFSFAQGTYTYTDLSNAGYAAYFTDSGGSITVGTIPEPHVIGLLALNCSLAMLLWLRRLAQAQFSPVTSLPARSSS